MNMVFIGPPGSGKGTQASRLSKQLGLAHLSTGDILREAVRNETELGVKAKSYMSAGELVPDELIIEMIREIVSTQKMQGGFILDGFPRTVPQAESLRRMLDEIGVKLDKVVLLDVDDDEIVRRLSGRWFCPECNTGYNYPMHMPKVKGRCDSDNAELQRRPDDEEAVVKNRLAVYKEQTEPIVDYYRNSSLLTEIDGRNGPDEVYSDLVNLTKAVCRE